MKIENITILKKNHVSESWNNAKIIIAVNKAAKRAIDRDFTEDECNILLDMVQKRVFASKKTNIPVSAIHNYVEAALEYLDPRVAKAYRDFRNYKVENVAMMERISERANTILYRGDKENSNADSALVSTKRSLTFNELNKELYVRFFLTAEELAAHREGYIYIHDMSARRDTMNCCLFDMENVLKGGFEMGNIWYNEPKTLDVCGDVIGDIALSAASQQYGGFTIPEIDSILAPYAEKSYNRYVEKYTTKCSMTLEDAKVLAWEDLEKEMEQVFQGWEYKFNTVASSRGDYPFTTLTFGLDTTPFGRLATKKCLEVRMGGQGKLGFKKPVLFPKLVFLYDEKLHGEGQISEDLFELGLDTSLKTMYPDWLSLSGKGYVSDIYQKYGLAISPMGCRAFLSPWWKKGGLYKADEEDTPIFKGRFNIGAVSLNIPMIYAKAKEESKNFFEVLDYYLYLIRKLHLRTWDYLGEMRASCNPLAYCQGGFLGGNLKPSDKIKPLLDSSTASFGITALNELQILHNGESLKTDGAFALEVMAFINQKVNQFKKEDGRLYAIYGTPAENLCGLQVQQFRRRFGIVEGVSDRAYVSNSFHLHVAENVTATEKQDKEYLFWDFFNGGKIQYVKYPIDYNVNAVKALIRRAMDMGFYEGVNMSLSYCDNCGYQELNMDSCPRCGSRNLTKIDRMNGYLSYSRVQGAPRLSEHKMIEISERRSM